MSRSKSPLSLDLIAQRTLAHYESNAAAFWEGTRDHDVAQNYAALLDALRGSYPPPPRVDPRWTILDFGCGPGRDLAALSAMGHSVVGLDGCAAFVEMARRHTGCEVLQQNFFELDLPEARFHGVFANAALFHVPGAVLPSVLDQLSRTLLDGGVLFCSNPRAFDADSEGWHGQRYGCYLTIASWTRVIQAAGLRLEQQFLRPSGEPEARQPWLAMVWRKPRRG
jgi:SAM-dependent methyltransferase